MSRRYSTNCRTGKVDPARKFKCTTAARAVVLILFLFSAPNPSNFLTRRCALCSYKIKCMIHVNINPTLCSLFSHTYISSAQFKYNHAIWFKNSLTINLFMIFRLFVYTLLDILNCSPCSSFFFLKITKWLIRICFGMIPIWNSSYSLS